MNKLLRHLCLVSVLALGLHASSCLASDKDVAVSDLPKAVTDAINKKFPDAKLVAAEKDTGGGNPYYEVKLQDNAKQWQKVDVRKSGEIFRVKPSDND